MASQFAAEQSGQQPRHADPRSESQERFAVQIKAKTQLTDAVVQLTLVRADGGDLPEWSAGSHIDVELECDMIRQYSLCGERRDHRAWQICVLHQPDGRGGSTYVHEVLSEGDMLTVAGPRNNFELVEAARYLFIAGGIGITPILPMIESAEESGADWTLIYGGRSPRTMAFKNELAETYGERVVLVPEDKHGPIELNRILSEVRPDTAVYACGPESLLRAVEAIAADSDDIDQVHIERFTPKSQANAPVMDDFEVEFVKSGITVNVGPQQSILDAARAVGIPAPFSCSEGTCGTCETNIVSGKADHRDSVLSAEEQAENSTLMICVSRSACSKLKLDL